MAALNISYRVDDLIYCQENANKHEGCKAASATLSASASSHDLYLFVSKLLMTFLRESSFYSVNIIKVLKLPFLPLPFSLSLSLPLSISLPAV